MWNLASFPFGDSVRSVQDRCVVCARRTIGSEIILDGPDGRNMICVERSIVSEIILDAPDGTPR